MPRVAVFNLSETRRDPRVRRTAAALVAMGCAVTVYGVKRESDIPREEMEGFALVRVDPPPSEEPGEMAALERFCPQAAALLHRCDPEVVEGRRPPRGTFGYRLRRLGVGLQRRWHRLAGGPPVWDPYDVLGNLRWVLLTNLAMARAALQEGPDLVWCNDLDTLLCGFMLKELRGLPLLYDAHEIFPEQLAPHQRSPIWHRFYTRLEQELIGRTDGRITVCDSLGEYFRQTYGAGEFLTLRNCPPRAQIVPEAVLARRNQPRLLLYHGNYFQHRGLDEVIRAARRVQGGRFLFRGFGPHEPALRRLVEREGVGDRVHFLPPVPVDRLVAAASECDVGLCPFVPSCLNTRYALPNKFFEYMSAGLATASADLVEMRRLTQSHGLGVLFDPTDVEGLARQLNDLLADPERLDGFRRQAWQSAVETFHWEREEERLREYLRPFLDGL